MRGSLFLSLWYNDYGKLDCAGTRKMIDPVPSYGGISLRQFAKVVAFVLAVAVVYAGCVTSRGGRGYYQVGYASWYGREYHGRHTANGERFNMRAMTAAHQSLPFGTRLRVTDLKTGRSVVVRINDRGPFRKGRILDLSYGAARRLGIVEEGVVQVGLQIL
jgi:rare lipoprotein A